MAAPSPGNAADSADGRAGGDVASAHPGAPTGPTDPGAGAGPATDRQGDAGFTRLWAELAPIGRDPDTGGYRRFSWTSTDMECREWFQGAARARGLRVDEDGNGNLWAWWGEPTAETPGVVTGSHLDSVPDGGAFDGPLGVVTALAAVDAMRARGREPARPIGIAVFTEEEGARFGLACLGSRLLTGAVSPDRALGLRDGAGVTLADALAAAGRDPARLGPDEARLAAIDCFVELHVEQGRALDPLGAPVGVAESIWPHGRWRFDFRGRGDHAGTTRLPDRSDPMLPFAATVLAAREAAARNDALATVGKVDVVPGGVNAIPSQVRSWLDARAPDEDALRRTVGDVAAAAERAAAEHGVAVTMSAESRTPLVAFEAGLRDRLVGAVASAGLPTPPVLPTGAGHDAGVLAARVPSAMLFVRNPTGVSHAPDEHAEPADCLAGVRALTAVLEDLAVRP